MVLSAPQVTAFFEDNDKMGLSNRTRLYLQGEGISHPEDLLEFVEKDAWKQIVEACRRPPQIANPA